MHHSLNRLRGAAYGFGGILHDRFRCRAVMDGSGDSGRDSVRQTTWNNNYRFL